MLDDEGPALGRQKTLVCFGDSPTEGARERLPAAVRVINAGINGDTTINLLRRYQRRCLQSSVTYDPRCQQSAKRNMPCDCTSFWPACPMRG
jgi:hypothetical protein